MAALPVRIFIALQLDVQQFAANSELTNLAFEPGEHGNINAPGNSRIVGGNDAGIGEYPFFVEWDACGAALIHHGEFHCFNPATRCLPFALMPQPPNLRIFYSPQT